MRERAKLTQEQAADRAGIHQTVISAIERGVKPNPELNTLKGLAAAYGRPVEAVLAALEITINEAAA